MKSLKTLLLLPLCFIFLFFVGCSKEVDMGLGDTTNPPIPRNSVYTPTDTVINNTQ